MTKRVVTVLAGCLLACGLPPLAVAGVTVYEKDDKKVEVGGRIQVQYLHEDPDMGPAEDETFFRRLRFYISGTVTKNWMGKIQADFGKAADSDEVAVKDAYMRYTGWKSGKIRLTIGNSKSPYSREFNTSSRKRQIVERPFTGDHNFGVPDRFIGFKLDGSALDDWLGWEVAVGQENHDPSADFMDFDTPANNKEDWNEGKLVAGRLNVFPWGKMKFDQGDFAREGFKANFSVAGFSWSNDDDNNAYTDPAGMSTDPDRPDLESASGWELSAGLRGRGVSVTAAVNGITGDTIDPMFTGGLYVNGTTDLDQLSVIGGYMVVKDRFEVVLGWQTQDADGYMEEWERTQFGLNYFYNEHKVKAQLTYTMGENLFGESGVDADTTQLQLQYFF